MQHELAGATWWDEQHPGEEFLAAYFSTEFALDESLPVYSGGLGVLAGDHLKSASELGVPLVGVGLFYERGYFRQTLDETGWQQERILTQQSGAAAVDARTATERGAAARAP